MLAGVVAAAVEKVSIAVLLPSAKYASLIVALADVPHDTYATMQYTLESARALVAVQRVAPVASAIRSLLFAFRLICRARLAVVEVVVEVLRA
jgi:hypothetical protein